MAGSLSDIKNGLAARLKTVPRLRVAAQIPEQVNPPVAVISRASVNYHRAMAGGATEWTMQIQLVAGRMAEKQSQRTIDAWLSWDGPQSVRAAIEADGTLGGVALDTVVTDADALSTFQIGDSEYLGVTMNVTVYG
jgi:hypothetical protein